MAYSITTYTGDGTAKDFPIVFNYLDRSHLRVRVDKVFTEAVGSDYEFEFTNDTTIRVQNNVTTAAVPAGLSIEFIRRTPITVPAVVFGGGASLSSVNLNKNSDYLTFALQEATDANEEFTKLYLGSFTAFPTSDNDGEALQVGAVIYYTPENALYYYTSLDTWIIGESTLAAQLFRDEAEASAIAAAADLVQTGLDVVATGADVVQTGLDVVQTGLDVVQTGLDVVATGNDRIAAETAAELIGKAYTTRASFVADVGYAPADGTVVTAGGLSYVSNAAATAIPDLLGWLPFGSMTALHFGAVGDGVSDDTTALQAALAAASVETLFITDGVYLASNLNVAGPVNMSPNALLRYNGVNNGTLLTVSANNLTINSLHLDAASNNCTQLRITGNDNYIGVIRVENGVASVTGVSSLYGVSVEGDNNGIGHCYVENFQNTGLSNESFPQALFFLGDQNFVGTVEANGAATLVATSTLSGTTIIDNIIARDISDNGIYQLGGELKVGSLTYITTSGVGNEPAVFSGDAEVGVITVYGSGSAIGFEDCGRVSIGRIEIRENALGDTIDSIIRTRVGNVSSGEISIGEIVGVMKQSQSLFALRAGTVSYLTINSMNITYDYLAGSPAITSWAWFDACQGFSIKDVDIRIIDTTNLLAGSDAFWLRGPTTNLAKQSYVGSIRVSTYDSNGTTLSDSTFRGVSLIQDLVHISSGVFMVNIGPYLNKVTNTTPHNGLYAGAAPSTGTWKSGTTLLHNSPAVGSPQGWVCTVAGTPGTWVAMPNL